MIGAKNLAYGTDSKTGNHYMTFKIGRNSRGVGFVKITYNYGTDLYDIIFMTHAGRVLNSLEGVFAEDLNKTIETNTGLHTKL